MKKREFVYNLVLVITTITVSIAAYFFWDNKKLQIGLAILCFLLWAYGMFIYPPKNEKPTKWYHYLGLEDDND